MSKKLSDQKLAIRINGKLHEATDECCYEGDRCFVDRCPYAGQCSGLLDYGDAIMEDLVNEGLIEPLDEE